MTGLPRSKYFATGTCFLLNLYTQLLTSRFSVDGKLINAQLSASSDCYRLAVSIIICISCMCLVASQSDDGPPSLSLIISWSYHYSHYISRQCNLERESLE